MAANQDRNTVLDPNFLVSVLTSPKELSTRLVRLSNLLSKEEEDEAIFKLEVESTVQVLIRKELLAHESSTVRIVTALCLTTLFTKIGFEEVVDVSDSQKMNGVFNLLIGCVEMLEKPGAVGQQAAVVLERLAISHILVHWAASVDAMKLLLETLLSIMSKISDRMVAVHMSQIMIDCLEAVTPVHTELVEILLSKLCYSEYEDDEEEPMVGEDEESSSSDSEGLMVHTQEAPEEKRKRVEKKISKEAVEAMRKEALLASDMIKGAARVVEPAIPLVIHSDVESERRKLAHHLPLLVERLAVLHAPLVSRILPDLIDPVADGSAHIRQQVVKTLSVVFLLPSYLNGCLDFAHLFVPFIGRMKDSELSIRLAMIEFSAQYLVLGAPQKGLEMVEKALRERVGERDTKVRVAAIEAIAAISSEPLGLDRISIETLKEVATRTLDRVDTVRLASARALGLIFRISLSKVLQCFEDVADTKINLKRQNSSESQPALVSSTSNVTTMHQEASQRLQTWKRKFKDFFSTIPSTIIERVFAKDLNYEERAYIDQFISEDFLESSCANILRHRRQLEALQERSTNEATSPNGKSTKKRVAKSTASSAPTPSKSDATWDATSAAHHIIYFTSSLSEHAARALYKWLDDKKALRDDIRSALEGPETSRRANILGSIEKRYGKPGKLEFSESIKEMLNALLNPRSLEKRVLSSADAIVRNIKKEAMKKNMFILVNKLHFRFFSTGLAKELINELAVLSASEAPNKPEDETSTSLYTVLCGHMPSPEYQLTTVLNILQRSVAIHPGYLSTLLDELDNLLKTSSDNRVTQTVARISSLTAALASEPDAREDHIKNLKKVVQAADSKTAAEAGAALLAHFTASEESSQEANGFIKEQLKIAIGPMSERVASSIASLTALVKLLTSSQALPLIHHIVKIVKQAYEAKQRTQLSNKNQSAPADAATPLTKAAVEGIQFAVSWLRNLASSAASTAKEPTKTPKKGAATTPFSKSPGSGKRGKAADPTSPNRTAFKLTADQDTATQTLVAALKNAVDCDMNDLDHAWLRAVALSAVLRLCEVRAYDELFDLDFFLRLSEIVMDDTVPNIVKQELRATLIPSLSLAHKLPIKFLAFSVIIAGDTPPLAPMIDARRQWIRSQTSAHIASKSSDELLSRLFSIALPEYALPWLIFILAHSQYLEEDAPKYHRTWQYLHHFLVSVLQASNFDFIYQILDDVRQLEDALEPESHNIHIVAEIGLRIISELRSHDSKMQRPDGNRPMDPKKVLLPAALFKPRYEHDESGKAFIKVSSNLPSYLPPQFVSPMKKMSSLLTSASHASGSSNTEHGPGRKRGKKSGTSKPRSSSRATRMDEDIESESSRSETSDEEMSFSSDEEEMPKNKKLVVKSSEAPRGDSVTSPSKRTTPSRKVKEKPRRFQLEDALSSSSEEGESVTEASSVDSAQLPSSPTKRKGKRPAPAKKTTTAKGKQTMDVDESEESAEPPAPKRPKRAAASPSPAVSKKDLPTKQLSSKPQPKESDSAARRTRSAASSQASLSPSAKASTSKKAQETASKSTKKRK